MIEYTCYGCGCQESFWWFLAVEFHPFKVRCQECHSKRERWLIDRSNECKRLELLIGDTALLLVEKAKEEKKEKEKLLQLEERVELLEQLLAGKKVEICALTSNVLDLNLKIRLLEAREEGEIWG
jgi:hypothetical protein